MNPRGIQVELPESATARLTELQIRRDNALALSHATQAALNGLNEASGPLYERLLGERDRHAQAHNHLHRLQSAINQFLFELRLGPGQRLAPVTVAAKLAKGETAAERVGALRIEMLSIQQELAKVRRAPLPIAEQVKAAEEFIARRALLATPRIVVQRDQLNLVFADDVITSKSDVFAVLCWLAPKSMLDALRREISAAEPPAGAMPAAVRVAKIAELSASLLALERKEVALLDDTTLPRPDTSPFLVYKLSPRRRQHR
jgi:hypothetical protein